MALAAAFAQLGLMHILLLVAGDTLHGELGLDVGAMAVAALGLGVGPLKSKARLPAMVEFGVLPLFNAVAVFTFHAELARMHVIDGMAIIAAHRNPGINFTGMA